MTALCRRRRVTGWPCRALASALALAGGLAAAASAPGREERSGVPPADPVEAVAERAADSELPLQVRFESPSSGQVVYGPARAEVRVLPSSAPVERVDFFVNGRKRAEDREPPYAYEWDAGYEFLSYRIEAVAYAPGRDPVRASLETARVAVREQVEVEDVPYDWVEIAFVVKDSSGKPVRGLGKADFLLEVDGAPTPIETLVEERRQRPIGGLPGSEAEARRPLSLALLLDVSRSMQLIERERFVLAVQRLLDHLRPEDEMMIISFSDDYEVRTDFTSDPRVLHEALITVPAPDLGTNLYDAIEEALDRLAERHGRRAVILYSDGQATVGRSSLTATPASLDVMDRTRLQPITLYWVIPHFQDAGIVQRTPALRRLADGSGGRWLLETDGIEKVLEEIGQELESHYSAAFFVDKKTHAQPYYDVELEARRAALQVQAPQIVKGSGSLERRLEEMLDSKDSGERLAAAIQLPRYGYSTAYLALRRRYGREKDSDVRDAVLAALLVVLRDEWQSLRSQPENERRDSLRHIERQIERLGDPRALALLDTLH